MKQTKNKRKMLNFLIDNLLPAMGRCDGDRTSWSLMCEMKTFSTTHNDTYRL